MRLKSYFYNLQLWIRWRLVLNKHGSQQFWLNILQIFLTLKNFYYSVTCVISFIFPYWLNACEICIWWDFGRAIKLLKFVCRVKIIENSASTSDLFRLNKFINFHNNLMYFLIENAFLLLLLTCAFVKGNNFWRVVIQFKVCHEFFFLYQVSFEFLYF